MTTKWNLVFNETSKYSTTKKTSLKIENNVPVIK